MSVSVWSEMSEAGHPAGVDDIDAILRLARMSSDSIAQLANPSAPDIDLVGLAMLWQGHHELNPINFIAMNVGVRAAKTGLDITAQDRDGYRFSEPVEINQLRTGIELGSEASRIRSALGRNTPNLLRGAVDTGRGGYVSLRSTPAFIGFSIGVREFTMREAAA